MLDCANHCLWSYDEADGQQPLTLNQRTAVAASASGTAARLYLVDNAATVQAIQVGRYSVWLLEGARVGEDTCDSVTKLGQSVDLMPSWWHCDQQCVSDAVHAAHGEDHARDK